MAWCVKRAALHFGVFDDSIKDIPSNLSLHESAGAIRED
jgi:hypothetical protein